MAKAQTVRSRARSSQRTVGADEAPVDPALPQKKRARHRLIGAIVLCAVAAIIVPLLLEPEPTRPLADLSVVIPPKTTNLPARGLDQRSDASPDAVPRDAKAPQASATDKSSAEVAKAELSRPTESRATDLASLESAPAQNATQGGAQTDADRTRSGTAADVPAAASSSSTGSSSAPLSSVAPAAKVTTPSSAAANPVTDTGKQTAAKPAGKYLIQVGAFSSESAATSALERIQGAGLRGFTERIKTDRGERIRVRAGPFSSRDSAEQAREKLKASGLEAALIAPS
jgi:DedD protein